MKSLFLLLLSFFTFNSFSMQRLAKLPILPASEATLMNFDEIPNSQLPMPIKPLKLWQSADAKAHSELQLATARVELLEEKHTKARRAYNTKKEKALDNLVYAAGYFAIPIVIDYTDYRGPWTPIVFGAALKDIIPNLKHTIGINVYTNIVKNSHFDWRHILYYLGAGLAIKSALQAGLEYRQLPAKPQESAELLAARQEKSQLLLTLQQAPEQS